MGVVDSDGVFRCSYFQTMNINEFGFWKLKVIIYIDFLT